MRIGCVDIGSNAVRTQIVEFGDNHHFKTLYQKRYPIRLGKSVFTNGKLKKKRIFRPRSLNNGQPARRSDRCGWARRRGGAAGVA